MSVLLRTKSNCGRKLRGSEVELHRLWLVYTKRAKDKHRTWSLTPEQFKVFLLGNCYYCGSKPSQKRLDHRGNRPPFLYNGIDRIDSSQGYEYHNIVTCCGFCNRAKSVYPVQEFLDYIQQLVHYRANLTSSR